MTTKELLQNLSNQKILSPQQAASIEAFKNNPLFSIHWELRTLLYIGIIFLTGGLGTLLYQNIDSIGHSAIVAFITLLCAAAFGYAYWKRMPFSRQEVQNSSKFADFALLLACLLFLILEGYLQYQYKFLYSLA